MTLPWMAERIQLRAIASLRPHAGNARVHDAGIGIMLYDHSRRFSFAGSASSQTLSGMGRPAKTSGPSG